MKVFISHPFNNENLASTLLKILKEKEIDAYMAQRNPEYEIQINQKITSKIDESDYIIALITTDTRASASTNQELGYSQGKNKPRIVMIEENAKSGVLIEGFEREEFTRENFEEKCRKVRKYLLENNKKKPAPNKSPPEDFLRSRNLLDDASESFGINKNSENLETPLKNIETTKKPFVLFSACPTQLLDEVPIKTQDFGIWLEKHYNLKLGNFQMIFLKGFKKIDFDSIGYYYDSPNKFTRYLELNENGFVEQGFTKPFIYRSSGDRLPTPFLHLCWVTGALWAFMSFCKKYYKHIGYNKEFDIILSVHGIKDLMLMGFGGKLENTDIWTDPTDWNWDDVEPRTDKSHLQIKRRISLEGLTEKDIENHVRVIADKLSNAFGFESARCYNYDGSLNLELLSSYNGK